MTASALRAIRRLVAVSILAGVQVGIPPGASAQDCISLYREIRTQAMYCGFFCDEDMLRPLQATYEDRCINAALPALARSAGSGDVCVSASQRPGRLVRGDILRRLGGAAPLAEAKKS